MNYLNVINNFWQCHREQKFSQSEIAVFFALADLYNRQCDKNDWSKPFELHNFVFYDYIGLCEMQLSRIRKRLIDRGVISMQKGQSKKSTPVYTFTLKSKDNQHQCGIKDKNNQHLNQHTGGIKRDFNQHLNQHLNQHQCGNINIEYKEYIDATNVARDARAHERPPEIPSSKCLTDEQLLAIYFPPDGANKDTEAMCMQWGVTIETAHLAAQEILRDWRLTGKTHTDQSDQRQHFQHLIRKKLNQHKQDEAAKRQKPNELTREEREQAFMQEIYAHINKPKDDGMSRLVF